MIQGLGLVIMLLMAATGTYGYLTWTPGTAMPPVTHTLFDVHSTLATYLGLRIVHVGAVLHELLEAIAALAEAPGGIGRRPVDGLSLVNTSARLQRIVCG